MSHWSGPTKAFIATDKGGNCVGYIQEGVPQPFNPTLCYIQAMEVLQKAGSALEEKLKAKMKEYAKNSGKQWTGIFYGFGPKDKQIEKF